MTQYVMNARDNHNMDAERYLLDEIRLKQAELEIKKTDLEIMKHQPETMRLQYDENRRSREHEAAMVALKLQQTQVERDIERNRGIIKFRKRDLAIFILGGAGIYGAVTAALIYCGYKIFRK